MIFDVARTLHFARIDAAALEFVEDLSVRLGHDVGQNVQPATMRHAEHDFLHAQLSAALDDLFQRRDHGFAAVQAEALRAEEAQGCELLEALRFDQLVEDRFLAGRREDDFLVGSFDAALQPIFLLGVVDVHELVADAPAIGTLQDIDHAPGRGAFHAHHAVDEDRAVEFGIVETVEGRIELRVWRPGRYL